MVKHVRESPASSSREISFRVKCLALPQRDSRYPLRLEWHHRGQLRRGQELTPAFPDLGNQRGDARALLGACLEIGDTCRARSARLPAR